MILPGSGSNSEEDAEWEENITTLPSVWNDIREPTKKKKPKHILAERSKMSDENIDFEMIRRHKEHLEEEARNTWKYLVEKKNEKILKNKKEISRDDQEEE